MSDLQELIARWRLYLDMEPQYGYEEVPTDDLRCLLDAAEAAATARDAALEEAAVFSDLWGYGWVAERIRDAKTGQWHLPKEEVYRRSLKGGQHEA